jgi:hypothetical protein
MDSRLGAISLVRHLLQDRRFELRFVLSERRHEMDIARYHSQVRVNAVCLRSLDHERQQEKGQERRGEMVDLHAERDFSDANTRV